jgi:hypothetical protein
MSETIQKYDLHAKKDPLRVELCPISDEEYAQMMADAYLCDAPIVVKASAHVAALAERDRLLRECKELFLRVRKWVPADGRGPVDKMIDALGGEVMSELKTREALEECCREKLIDLCEYYLAEVKELSAQANLAHAELEAQLAEEKKAAVCSETALKLIGVQHPKLVMDARELVAFATKPAPTESAHDARPQSQHG